MNNPTNEKREIIQLSDKLMEQFFNKKTIKKLKEKRVELIELEVNPYYIPSNIYPLKSNGQYMKTFEVVSNLPREEYIKQQIINMIHEYALRIHQSYINSIRYESYEFNAIDAFNSMIDDAIQMADSMADETFRFTIHSLDAEKIIEYVEKNSFLGGSIHG